MTSDRPQEAFVWAWLPDGEEPVIACRAEAVADIVLFNYGRSYLARTDAIPLYLPELPLRTGSIEPPSGMQLAGCINDSSGAFTTNVRSGRMWASCASGRWHAPAPP